MKQPAKSPLAAGSKRQQNQDFTGKEFFQNLRSLITVLEPACTFLGERPVSIMLETVEMVADFLALVELDTGVPPWEEVSSTVTEVAVQVEFVDRLRDELLPRLRIYHPLITNELDDDALVIQHVVVVGNVQPDKRKEQWHKGGDRRGRPVWLKVHLSPIQV